VEANKGKGLRPLTLDPCALRMKQQQSDNSHELTVPGVPHWSPYDRGGCWNWIEPKGVTLANNASDTLTIKTLKGVV